MIETSHIVVPNPNIEFTKRVRVVQLSAYRTLEELIDAEHSISRGWIRFEAHSTGAFENDVRFLKDVQSGPYREAVRATRSILVVIASLGRWDEEELPSDLGQGKLVIRAYSDRLSSGFMNIEPRTPVGLVQTRKRDVGLFREFVNACYDGISAASENTGRKYDPIKTLEGSALSRSHGVLTEFCFGQHCYRLRMPSNTSMVRSPKGWHFIVLDLPELIGTGIDHEKAIHSFKSRFHKDFQRLHNRPAFHMSDSDRKLWEDIDEFVDVEAYCNETPMAYREIGHVVEVQGNGRVRVAWINQREETVSLESADGKLAAFEEGQWFEASVVRKGGALGATDSILGVTPRGPLVPLDDEGASELVDDGLFELPRISVDEL